MFGTPHVINFASVGGSFVQKHIKALYFETISAGTTTGTVSKPANGNATFIMDEWGTDTDALLSTLENGKPTFKSPVDASGTTITTTFNEAGGFTFSGTPDPADAVALVYVYTCRISDFNVSESLFESELVADAVLNGDFDATSFLYATVAGNPESKTPAQVRDILALGTDDTPQFAGLVLGADGTISGANGPSLYFESDGLASNRYLQGAGGAFVWTGADGAVPVTGAGARMMWVPSASAFRAGAALADEWDAGSVGDYSTGFGYNILVSGTGAFGQGYAPSGQIKATDIGAFAQGYVNASLGYIQASGYGAFAQGVATGTSALLSAEGIASVVHGYASQAGDQLRNQAAGALIVGYTEGGNIATGANAYGAFIHGCASGASMEVTGKGCFAGGCAAITISTPTAGEPSFAFGKGISISADNAYVFGKDITTTENDCMRVGWSAAGGIGIKNSSLEVYGSFDFDYDGGTAYSQIQMTTSGLVLNADSQTYSLQVKSATVDNALFVAGTGAFVGINTASQWSQEPLHVTQAADAADGLIVAGPSAANRGCHLRGDANGSAYFGTNLGDREVYLATLFDLSEAYIEVNRANYIINAVNATAGTVLTTTGFCVGAVSPSEELEVNKDGTTVLMIRDSGEDVGYSAYLTFSTGTGGSSASNLVAGLQGIITQADPSALKGELAFLVNTGDSTAEAMRIDDSGNVGIGTDSPDGILHLKEGASGATVPAGADTFILESNVNVGMCLLCPNTSVANIFFGDEADNDTGRIKYTHSIDAMQFFTGGTERMRIRDGNVYIGEIWNAEATIGLTINQDTNTDEILTLKSSNVAHGATALTETDTFAYFGQAIPDGGGLLIRGFKDATGANSSAFRFDAFLGENPQTGTGSGNVAIMDFYTAQISGTSFADVVSDGNCFAFRCRTGSAWATNLLIKESGLAWIRGEVHVEGGVVTLAETTTPTAVANYGKIYCKNDNKLYFQDGAGTEHEISFV